MRAIPLILNLNPDHDMNMRKPDRWVIGNWKMNGTLATNASLLEAISGSATENSVSVAVCAPYPYLTQLQRSLGGRHIRSGAQDVSEHASGAFTGQVSAAMLREFGTSVVLVGHSERRQYSHESSELVALKAAAAVAGGLTTVICVGENLEQREGAVAEATVAAQLAACAEVVRRHSASIIVAYEPVWAIGTGKTATPAEAQSMHAFIRAQLVAIDDAARSVSLLYGGSVKPANARELFGQPDIDGGLIGGASLNAEEFLAIISAAL